MKQAQQEIDESLEALTKAAIHELRGLAKPHPMVEKTMQIVVALKGFRNASWNTAKELMNRPSFKIDLM
jgi:hypothetical protein